MGDATPVGTPGAAPAAADSPTPSQPDPTPPLSGGVGLPRVAVIRAASPGTRVWHVPVLMYHLVATRAEAGDARPSLVVTPRSFAAQMTALRARGWRTITAADLAADVREGVVPPPRTFVITFDDGHEDGYAEAFPILRADGFVATFFVITDRVGRLGYLTASQLAEMEAAGMEIGDHTVHHVALAAASPSKAVAEIAGAAATIASVVGSAPSTLAYPYGSHDAGAETIVGRLGLAMAFTEVSGCRESYATRLAIPRIRVTPSTTATDLVARMATCR